MWRHVPEEMHCVWYVWGEVTWCRIRGLWRIVKFPSSRRILHPLMCRSNPKILRQMIPTRRKRPRQIRAVEQHLRQWWVRMGRRRWIKDVRVSSFDTTILFWWLLLTTVCAHYYPFDVNDETLLLLLLLLFQLEEKKRPAKETLFLKQMVPTRLFSSATTRRLALRRGIFGK